MENNNNNNYNKAVNEENEDFSNGCGIGSWRPKWLQRFASPKFFLINFSLMAIVQGASFTYLIGSITTLERRYGFDSKISGLILTADNISQIIVNPIIGYLGSRFNRPMIMAIGELIFASSLFIASLPYFIFGSKEELTINGTLHNPNEQYCGAKEEGCTQVTNWKAVYILWSSSFVSGIGYTGLPYMDDNTKKKNIPMYLSLSGSLRLLGPSMGFILSSFCLSIYENPFSNPGFNNKDPRWIGAWWIGFMLIACLIILCSLPLMIFPSQMRANREEEVQKEESSPFKIREMLGPLMRILKNPIFMFHLIGVCLRIFGYMGYYFFKPKYMEAQFSITPSKANFFTGIVSIPPLAIGIMAGGLALMKFKPSAKKVVIYMFVVDMITNLAILSIMFLKCPHPVFAPTAISPLPERNLDPTMSCFANCSCNKRVFHPICGNKRKVYFNQCFAGCINSDKKNCACIGTDLGTDSTVDREYLVEEGYCKVDCGYKLEIYLAIMAIAGVIMSTAKVGDTLLVLRCVEPRDKNMAMGVLGSFLGLFAFIPYPVVFGWITDLACMNWKESCGKTGNCFRYDIEKLSSFGIVMIGTLFIVPVIFYANRIKDMFEDENQNENNLYELGAVNEGFHNSEEDHKNNKISVVQIITNLNGKGRKQSIIDCEIVQRKNSFVAL